MIRLENREWNDIRIRIMFINNSPYVENISDVTVEFGIGDDCHSLVPFRPLPLSPGNFDRKGEDVLRYE